MASGYYRSDSVLRTDNIPCSSHVQEHGKQQRHRAASVNPAAKRPQSQASPGKRSQSQVTISQANSAKKPQASPVPTASQGNHAQNSIHSRTGQQSSGSGLPLDTALTKTEDAKLFKAKKGKKPQVIQVKECAEVIDNVENSLAKPSTICISKQNGNRGLTVARCVALLNMADGARDVSTLPISAQASTKVRTTWSTTPPNSSHGSPNDQIPSSPYGSKHKGAKARPACSPPTSLKSSRERPPRISHNRPKPRTAWLTPPSSARKCEKVRPSSSTHKGTKPRTASTPPSSERESNTFEKQNALSKASMYSDATEISGPWSSEVDEDVRGFSVPDVVDRSVRETPEPDIEEMGDFVASSRSSISDPRTPYGLPYEDYPTDDDELDGISLSYDEPRYPQKSLGSYLEAQGELDGQNKEEFKLGLDRENAENPTPREALTYNIRKVAMTRQRTQTKSIQYQIMSRMEEDVEFRDQILDKLRRQEEADEEWFEMMERIKAEEIRNMEEKKEKRKEGRVRRLIRRLRDVVVCCVRRQGDD